jgi:hypothetical protein
MRVLVVDGSEGSIYYNIVKKYIPINNISAYDSRDRAFKTLVNTFYDIVVSYGGETSGNVSHEKLIDYLKRSKVSTQRPLVICIEHNPRVRSILDIGLSAFRHFSLDVNQKDILEEVLTKVAKGV